METTLTDTHRWASTTALSTRRLSWRVGGFIATFLLAWLSLDQLVTSPPLPASALVSLAGAGLVLVVGELVVFGTSPRALAGSLGLGRPAARSVVAAVVVGLAVVAFYLVGAALLDIDVSLRSNWLSVLVGALLFHGLAEELAWRGFAFAHIRRGTTFWRAIGWSIPLIALTHVPIIASNGWGVGSLAVASAALTCIPLAHLWERSGGTAWSPAIVHGLIGTWQVFDRGYGAGFSLWILTGSIVVPFVVFLFGDRFFGCSRIESLNTRNERTYS